MTDAQPATEQHVGTLELSGEGNREEVVSPISDEAIALAAQAFYGGAYLVPDSEMNDLLKQGARAALEAAYPAIREQVAEEIAVAIEAADQSDEGDNNGPEHWDAYSISARIARQIGEPGWDATSAGQGLGADLTAGANVDPSHPPESQALSKRLPGVVG